MIALDDSALARLVIAAGAMPREARGRWLADLAAQLEGRAPCSAAAVKQRRYRQRRNGGKISVRLSVDADAAVIALESIGALPAALEHNRSDIEQALQEQLSDWLDGWRQRGG